MALSTVGRASVSVPILGWESTTPLPQALTDWNAVAHDQQVYYLGGRNTSGVPINTVYVASMQDSGELGAWSTTTPLPEALYLHATAASDTHIFVVGGWDGGQTNAQVYSAPFLPGGGIGAWTETTPYPVSLDLHGAVVVNNRLYVLGGWDGEQPMSKVAYADLAGGTVGQWKDGPALPQAVYRSAVAAFGSYIYVTGGVTGAGDTLAAQSAVYVARVNGDGTLGAWQTTTPLPQPRYYHRVVVHDGRLVLLAGRNDTTEFDSVFAAEIGSNGTIGAWSAEPSLPQPIHRFGAVTATLYDGEYIFVLGGLNGSALLRNVYYSTAPMPTPTPTATPTATPTPPPSVSIHLQNEPKHWIAPGEEITYTISYHNDGALTVSDVQVVNTIPDHTELIPESVAAGATVSSPDAGSSLSWRFDQLEAGERGDVSYRVRRITPTPVSSIPSALSIGIDGPARANPGDPIQYSLTITNEVPIPLTNLVISNTLPFGASYVEGSGGTVYGRDVIWFVPEIAPDNPGPPRVPSTVTVQYAVTANQTLVNAEYRVQSFSSPGGSPGPTGIGRDFVITQIGDTPPAGPGDGVFIWNDDAALTWRHEGVNGSSVANPVRNPSIADNDMYLPIITR